MKDDHDPAASGAPTEESASEARASDGQAEGEHPSAPATLEEALERLEQMQTALQERDDGLVEARDGLLRERAELENFKKRMARERAEALRYASEPLLRDLLPVIDNLERALNAAPPPGSDAENPMRDGIAMVARQFEEILGRFGVQRIEAAGRPFDPNDHEALAHIETTLAEAGHVLEEHLPGYRLHDRLLRAAQVAVAKAPTNEGN